MLVVDCDGHGIECQLPPFQELAAALDEGTESTFAMLYIAAGSPGTPEEFAQRFNPERDGGKAFQRAVEQLMLHAAKEDGKPPSPKSKSVDEYAGNAPLASFVPRQKSP